MLIHALLGPGPNLLTSVLESQSAESDLQKGTTSDPHLSCLWRRYQCYLPGITDPLTSYIVAPWAPQHQRYCSYLVLIDRQLFRPNPRPAEWESEFQYDPQAICKCFQTGWSVYKTHCGNASIPVIASVDSALKMGEPETPPTLSLTFSLLSPFPPSLLPPQPLSSLSPIQETPHPSRFATPQKTCWAVQVRGSRGRGPLWVSQRVPADPKPLLLPW